MKDTLKEYQIYNKTELKILNGEINSLKKENIELLQRISTYQSKVSDLELILGFERKNNK